MNDRAARTFLSPQTPELPVEDVERAQRHYRDALGFEIRWLHPSGAIGAVARDDVDGNRFHFHSDAKDGV